MAHVVPPPEGSESIAWPSPFGKGKRCLRCTKSLVRSGYWFVHAGSRDERCYPPSLEGGGE